MQHSQKRRILTLLLLSTLTLGGMASVLAFTPVETHIRENRALLVSSVTPSPFATPFSSRRPTATPRPSLMLTSNGKPPAINASSAYLLDMDSGHVLADVNAQKPLPMASTTKIMTTLIAIQTGVLDRPILIQQDAVNQAILYNGSSANLIAGDKIPLKDLLYGLMLPSGDDAAIAIADGLAGTTENFVQRMNLFAYRLHLFQTHYTNPDGLTPDGEINPNHYTTARDLVHLADYAMSIPLFAQIVQTRSYSLPAAPEHHAYSWTNTNTLLTSYSGMLGIKTGHTMEAGYCLVFAAIRAQHRLLGAVLASPNEEQRNQDVVSWLNWGFALPLGPPT